MIILTQREAVLRCRDCGGKLKIQRPKGPAPLLAACLEARQHGWKYGLGFDLVFDPYHVRCPDCYARVVVD